MNSSETVQNDNHSSAKLNSLRSQVNQLQNRLEQTEAQLAAAHALIEGMESSKFWKLRTQWFKLKRFLRLPQEPEFSPDIANAKATNNGNVGVNNGTVTKLPYYRKDPTGCYLFGMTTADEQAYTEEYAKTQYTGEGKIVELGCFMGAFSISMGRGLKENIQVKHKEKSIHAYDIFLWDKYIAQMFAEHETYHRYQPGDSFLDGYLEVIAPYQEYINVHPGDLTKLDWNGDSIEFLLIDAMKSWELANSIMQKFFPYLIPGKSLVHHQDFSYHWTTWIHLTMYRLREYFQPLYYVPEASVIFKYIKEIPSDILAKTYSIESFSEEEIRAAFDYSLSIVPDFMEPNIAAAKITTYFQKNDLDQARYELEKVIEKGLYRNNYCYYEIEQWLN